MSIIQLPTDMTGPKDSFENIVTSCEALQANEDLKTAMANVTDLFVRTANVLRVNLTRFFQSVKRGELEKYCNDHGTVVRAIESLNYFNVKDTAIDSPLGMATPYPKTVENLSEALDGMKIETFLDNALKSAKRIRQKLLNKEDAGKDINDLYTLAAAMKNSLGQSESKRNASFDAKDHSYTFGKSFSSMEEFRRTRIATIDTEKYLYRIDRINQLCGTISGVFSDISDVRNPDISKPAADHLAEAALVTAKVLDLYGNCCLDLMAVSHNMTIVINKLYQLAK